MAHAPASYGSNPPEANSKGSLNDMPSIEQRAPKAKTESEKTSGPVIGDNGSYLPATYDQRITHPIHGETTVTRTDR